MLRNIKSYNYGIQDNLFIFYIFQSAHIIIYWSIKAARNYLLTFLMLLALFCDYQMQTKCTKVLTFWPLQPPPPYRAIIRDIEVIIEIMKSIIQC